MPRDQKHEITLYDEECEVQRAWIETMADGTTRYLCKVNFEAYLDDGTRLAGKGTLEIQLAEHE